jgi:uncharacterized protein (TIGR02118 family)
MGTMENRGGVARRTGLAFGLAAASGGLLLAAGADAGPNGKGMVKVTVLYGAPTDPAAFESYYADHHMPMVYAVKGIARIELSRPMPGPDGKPPAFYRLTELWFKNAAAMKAVTGRPEWKQITDDVPNFATGGATILVSTLE